MLSEFWLSILIASFKAIAKDLKHDSIMWWVLQPYKFSKWIVIADDCVNDWKNSLKISVSMFFIEVDGRKTFQINHGDHLHILNQYL